MQASIGEGAMAAGEAAAEFESVKQQQQQRCCWFVLLVLFGFFFLLRQCCKTLNVAAEGLRGEAESRSEQPGSDNKSRTVPVEQVNGRWAQLSR